MPHTKTTIASLLAATLLPLSAHAGHYVAGVEGLGSAVVPGPGVYYRGYAVHYDANSYEGALPSNSDVTVDALANRFIWVTEAEFLGANVALETIIPLVNTDLNVGSGLVEDEQFGLGDVFLGGVLGWHGERWDTVAAAGIWNAIGKTDKPADPGLGYAELMLTLGANFYLTEAKDVTLNLLSRYEIADDKDVDDEFLIEWSLGKKLSNGLELGLVGYDQWRLEGGDQEKHAVGVEAGYFWPQVMTGLNLAAYNEYDVDENFDGYSVRLTLTKVF